MAREVVVIPVHGMGDTDRDFDQDLKRRIRDELSNAEWQKVHWQPIYYQPVLQDNQQRVFRDMRRAEELDGIKLRKFLLYGFSDAAGLEHHAESPGSPYEQAQQIIFQALEDAFQSVGGRLKPVVLIAQSLGGQLMSNYIWDAQKAGGARYGVWRNGNPLGHARNTVPDRFHRLKTLRFFITTGCNIPVFVAGFARNRILPVKHDSSGYSFQWFNYFDEDDVLGWPLQPLSPQYRAAVRDVPVNAGGNIWGHLFKSWNVFSHGQYWTDGEVVRPVAGYIRSLIP